MFAGKHGGFMEVRKLAPGRAAPEGADFVRLNLASNGKIELTAAIGSSGSLSLGTYDSIDDAQRAGLHWIVGRGIGSLYIEMSSAHRT